MNVHEPHQMSIDELLVNCIDRRNAASAHELVRRKMQAGKGISRYLAGELFKLYSAELLKEHKVTPPSSSLEETFNGEAEFDWSMPVEGNIYKWARKAVEIGFKGQGMREVDKAEDYIIMAADNPNVEDELPESGVAFWKAAVFAMKRWKARKALGKED